MSNEHLTESIDALIPKSLDAIIRKNRELASIYLSTQEELAPLMLDRLEGANIHATINSWRLITINSLEKKAYRVRLLGEFAHNGDAWCTSVIRLIDLDHGVVLTHHNYYGLGTKGEGEPPFRHLASLCAALHNQGVGEFFGVPYFEF